MQVIDAYRMVAEMYRGHLDKAGKPTSEHLIRVFLRVLQSGGNLDQQIAALMHDTIEDGKATAHTLLAAGVPRAAVGMVLVLSRQDGQTYMDYIRFVKQIAPVAPIKEADIEDNLDPNRMAELPPEIAASLGRRYRTALEFLRS